MFKKSFSVWLPVVVLGLALFVSGCQPKPKWDKENAGNAMVPSANPDPAMAPLDNQSDLPGASNWTSNPNELAEAGADKDGWVPVDPANRLGMPVIYFAYDSDVLVPSEQKKIERIAAYLADKAELGLLIEGHCDQRGTEEYNRALGERRANAIRAALEERGLASNRIKTQSFGKDKPAVEGSGDSVWRQNRRGVPVPMRMPR